MKNNHISTMLLIEKMSKTPNKNIIQILQQVIDGKLLSFEEFISTGLFMPRDSEFIKPMTRLKYNCKNVVMYMGGFSIQVLESEDKGQAIYFWEFFDNEESDEMHTQIYSPNLKDIEKAMWELQVNKYFNI